MSLNIFKYGPPQNIITLQKGSRNSTFTTTINNSVLNLINTTNTSVLIPVSNGNGTHNSINSSIIIIKIE